ncbi:unnamed protein product [Medioppia subpectinata]|uniref:Uncharacterized protein n=1 Tax=Medioppia subpectinata TaxID=1979941 RepID=A0A7R9L6L9_9ACAR|nr:unnamed protein product [Medioppia subpectinata]CAG2116319.1 unnamed protein product [Medioppia subpectinata]
MAQKYRCDREETNADLRIKEMFLFAADQQDFPTNEVQMKAFCKDSKRRDTEMKTYAEKCLNSNTKSVTNLLTYSVSKNTANTCKSRRRSQDFQRVGACGNAARKGARKCWNNWIDTTYTITRISNHKLKIPLSCWSV